MKIGLVSYHSEPNYGTMLQAYALAEALRMLDRECEYIRYVPRRGFPRIVEWSFAVLKRMLRSCGIRPRGEFDYFSEPEFGRIVSRFRDFHRRFIPVSKRVYYTNTIRRAGSVYDFFIVGSDQTWSSYMNRYPRTINFLPFVSEPSKKRAYAPSIGTTRIGEAYRERLGRELSSFGYLSCRERPNCRTIGQLTGKQVAYVVDPTLLLGPKEWDEAAVQVQMPPRYILCYILGTKPCISDFAERLAERERLPVYYILTRPEYAGRRHVLSDVGPQEFVGLIRGASCVVTDSFHGTVFSINYGVEFYSFAKRAAGPAEEGCDNDRIRLFLDELGIGCRFKNDGDMSLGEKIDYAPVHDRLRELRAESWNYLQTIVRS